ncbi:DEAH box polypeptide 36 [Ephemerocybe angulata]|uniref:DEAH box polypeptide 36 n=1 Tax=Ephemerocybe angulata TaxID=980116 RepID=A0A8H6IHX9_9AGAR|nr:DEAH box polypeptide 36 [Tulosesus angulatus]
MRRAALSRARRFQLMQTEPTRGSDSHPGIKRPLQQTSPTPPSQPPTSSKVPRVDDVAFSHNFSGSRRTFESTQGRGMPQSYHGFSKSNSHGFRSSGFAGQGSSRFQSAKRGGKAAAVNRSPLLEGPVHDEAYITQQYRSPVALKAMHQSNPKGSLGNFAMVAIGAPVKYVSKEGVIEVGGQRSKVWRTTADFEVEGSGSFTGIGDHPEKKSSERLCALSAVLQLHIAGLLDAPKKKIAEAITGGNDATLSDGSTVNYEQARSFMDYYCRRFNFGKPDIAYEEVKRGPMKWEAVMSVDESRIGVGKATNKKAAEKQCYLDVAKYLESCDPPLWKAFVEASKSGKDLGMAQKVRLQISEPLDDFVRDTCSNIRHTQLYRNRPAKHSSVEHQEATKGAESAQRYVPPRTSVDQLADKSRRLLEERQKYLANPSLEKMRATRAALPVYTRSDDILKHIRDNDITICMAATGSGKTTQIPQIILDEFIDRGEGAKCNIVCTQPRRLAAISVADRVSKERGQTLGASIGYQVRFEAKLPQENGSVTFCTTGIFLKRLQSALSGSDVRGTRSMDAVTHIVVDEVHERDVDTDLLLVVLKRLLQDRKARGKPIKIVLMSATIDPTLFQQYFPSPNGQPAPTIDIPGRTFPVTKYHLDDFVPKLIAGNGRWLLNQEPVAQYLYKELGPAAAANLGVRVNKVPSEAELDLPYPLIAATIAHVLQQSGDGHVLVFLPGWEEITATQRALEQPMGPLPVNISDRSKYSIHLLHSTIPLAEQQVIFEPPPPGIRRVILATNIAETSITIPDVVYVVDTAKIKEIRYDPERHMSSLVSAWVGRSNLNQRAGRAGRHRSGEYFGILGKEHAEMLHPHQTVEMKRVDLSNVVMHVKALNFPGMTVEEVLAETIEPPAPERVSAAVKDLQMVGALDALKNLTSLGRVLLSLPVEAQMGRLVLYGSFFKCLDQALTLAAILTNRDPFVCPMHLKREAQAKKNSWAPDEFRSDALGTLRAFNAWWALQSRGDYVLANRFCVDNFLAKPTLLMIQKIKQHLLQALDNAGVLEVSAGGNARRTDRLSVPPELNTNGESLPLLAGLIAIASQPKFAVRTGEKTLRTENDKMAFMHPSSVNHRKKELPERRDVVTEEKQIFAFAEKRRNAAGSGSPQTYLITTTKLDPLTYMLFGAYDLAVAERGLVCDNWLPIVGNVDALDNIQRLKSYMEASMLRVFEGIAMSRRQTRPHNAAIMPREEEEEDLPEVIDRDYSLSAQEVKELDFITRDIVTILTMSNDERMSSQSTNVSRPVTPMDSPLRLSTRLPGGIQTGYNTPYQSRPGTPSRLSRRF